VTYGSFQGRPLHSLRIDRPASGSMSVIEMLRQLTTRTVDAAYAQV
jgi:hypothetical protein